MDDSDPVRLPLALQQTLPVVLRPGVVGVAAPSTRRTLTLPALTQMTLVVPNPGRISFYVLRLASAAGVMSLSPLAPTSEGGVTVTGPGGFAAMTADVWFSLIQERWFISSAAGEDVTVIEIARNW